jgi:hypothetical protein
VVTDATLQVKHETYRTNYNKTARYKGSVLHFGIRFIITAIASAKLALMKKNLYFFDYINGFGKRSCQNSIVGN